MQNFCKNMNQVLDALSKQKVFNRKQQIIVDNSSVQLQLEEVREAKHQASKDKKVLLAFQLAESYLNDNIPVEAVIEFLSSGNWEEKLIIRRILQKEIVEKFIEDGFDCLFA